MLGDRGGRCCNNFVRSVGLNQPASGSGPTEFRFGTEMNFAGGPDAMRCVAQDERRVL